MEKKMKYHITGDGRCLVCKADKKPCKYGSFRHFEDTELAKVFIDDENKASRLYEKLTELLQKEENIENVLKELRIPYGVSGLAKGTELRALLSRMNRNRLYGAENPKMYLNTEALSPQKLEEIEYIKEVAGINGNPTAMFEDDHCWYIWTNDVGDRDVVIYDKIADRYTNTTKEERPEYFKDDKRIPVLEVMKGKNIVQRIEVKDYTNKAQLTDVRLKTNNTKIVVDDKLPKCIQKALGDIDTRYDSYTNKVLDISNDEALEYFLTSYKEKGADEIFLNNAKTGTSFTVSLDDIDRARAFCKSRGVGVTVQTRINHDAKSVTKKDKEVFLNHYGGLFVDGKAKEEFTIKDLKTKGIQEYRGAKGFCYVRHKGDDETKQSCYANTSKKALSRPFVRIGDFVYSPSNADLLNDKKLQEKVDRALQDLDCIKDENGNYDKRFLKGDKLVTGDELRLRMSYKLSEIPMNMTLNINMFKRYSVSLMGNIM